MCFLKADRINQNMLLRYANNEPYTRIICVTHLSYFHTRLSSRQLIVVSLPPSLTHRLCLAHLVSLSRFCLQGYASVCVCVFVYVCVQYSFGLFSPDDLLSSSAEQGLITAWLAALCLVLIKRDTDALQGKPDWEFVHFHAHSAYRRLTSSITMALRPSL